MPSMPKFLASEKRSLAADPAMLRHLALALFFTLQAPALDLQLPTENHHLFSGKPDKFYMYVDRIFEGEVTKPWEGGSFGFVRTPIRLGQDVVLTKFHEGIDIQPAKRDKAGNPLDLVLSVSDGVVVHASPIAGRSNYGRYVVVEHPLDGHAFYSVYAHLAEITAKPGDPVKTGSVLGRMGYTGAGINRVRAHLHLELCVLMSRHFGGWHRAFSGGTNFHGNFNGMNLAGMDVAKLFLDHRENPELRIQDFVTSTPAYFKVTIPRTAEWDFAKRHPWMVKSDPSSNSPSWEISFSATGLPVAITASTREVAQATVTAVRNSRIAHRHLTRGLIDGNGPSATLTRSGQQLVALITDDFAK
ncbi:MAG: M23 family metallopeptidase [Verrucomicrobia bacterium]|nr:MAG: M23 family metallopeptidase [Verrucomicrobiota bacterium]TAF24977.1 MAG: M23 family metallopeptidase [Verrucomicrobiota bacterium]TAF40696.1 MAG: M23 family metallopeptidase [Verrucomicrobiota bacterium]